MLLESAYPVSVGATTIWEHWESFDGKSPKRGMNSLNHYTFGSVGEYLYGHIGGIRNETPGYQKILIEPQIREGLTWSRVQYESICGEIVSAWKIEDDLWEMEIAIPANTSAIIFIPAINPEDITESAKPAKMAQGVISYRNERGRAIFEVGSGHYYFATKSRPPSQRDL